MSQLSSELPGVSIVIPFRNEEETIEKLLISLTNLSYPKNKIEMVWVNDHSTDKTCDIINAYHQNHNFPYPFQLLELSQDEWGKRKALSKGILKARFEIIATLDADCTVDSYWLAFISSYLTLKHVDLVVGPVGLEYRNNFFSKFMALEQISLTATAAASAWSGNPILCSGANMLFYKRDFIEYLKNYAPPLPIGDDVFFMLSLKKLNKKIGFIANRQALVFTQAPKNLNEFIKQRLRWVSKSRFYSDPAIIAVALLVAIANISILIPFLTMLYNPAFFHVGLAGMFLKTISDFPFLYMAAKTFADKNIMRIYIPAQLIYPIFVCFASIRGNLGKITWKQRVIND
ncbi:MAG: glycosyltransferase [Bacteroidales bacterium]|nr:glycosyltransferase [Bacteroidales bacterium]